LQVICNYFNVSEEWLLTGNEKESTIKGVKSPFEVEIQKIVKAELYSTQKEIQDINKKLSELSSALSELILKKRGKENTKKY
jgi:hypothetical protein